MTGYRRELVITNPPNVNNSYLVDCGLFQGAETSSRSVSDLLAIEFDFSDVRALVVTHCHIDHVGRIPYLLAAGFSGPIFCSTATALLLPEVISDALKVGGMQGKRVGSAILRRLKSQLVAVEYGIWCPMPVADVDGDEANGNEADGNEADGNKASALKVKIKFKPAGHILGSAYIEFDVSEGRDKERVVFSGDLGACYTPLLPCTALWLRYSGY